MSTARGIVIVGSGQGGVQLADSLRGEGYTGPIDLFGTEVHLPYQRPPLSKDFLGVPDETGQDATALPIRAEKFFVERDVTFHPGVGVETIDPAAATITAVDGQVLPYRDLVLATGARNRALRIPGAELAGVHSLRTLDDAAALRADLLTARRALVVGAGFIGLEFAASARAHGVEVTVLEMAPRMMGRVLSPEMSDHFHGQHTAAGVRTVFGEGITEILGEDGRVVAGVGSSGTRYPADLVVVGVGVLPNIEIAQQAGLAVGNGIVVDEYLRSSDPHVWALGDCCAYPDARTGALIRLESVQNAVDQAKILARTLTGTPTPYAATPWFWSHQGGNRLQIAGLIPTDARSVLRGDPASGSFSVFRFVGDDFAGAESVNNAADHLAARRILDRSLPLTPEQVADPTFDLKGHSRTSPVPAA
ncbi:FAD-dependent oxidoreductase [Nakamurella flavida]|uniref:FAD-dependent oxidoreductase n=1 Tax=Nakamurella flavida TaxID=363630 RepID=A0A938YEZ3_9ACTN|nr:FAD-dependent oxidoreductase [Nakamurella flavida]MBM9476451.1 FAD-dependent oxidoreductase [Nakamurella flavida]MDP9779448.1 3-phenylpropionate/trans-cinnamate dioxygenase ferredoxin reductase subunit [Nakamurella flavida]